MPELDSSPSIYEQLGGFGPPLLEIKGSASPNLLVQIELRILTVFNCTRLVSTLLSPIMNPLLAEEPMYNF